MGNTSSRNGDIRRNDELRQKLRKIYEVEGHCDSFFTQFESKYPDTDKSQLKDNYQYINLLKYGDFIDKFYQEKFPPNSQLGNSCGYDSNLDTKILEEGTKSSSIFQNSQLTLLNAPSHDPSN